MRQHAIFADKRYHVGNGCDRHHVEQTLFPAFRNFEKLFQSAPSSLLKCCLDEFVCDRRAAQMREWIPSQFWVHDCERNGHLIHHFVVISDDDIHSQFIRDAYLISCSDANIDRYYQTRASRLQLSDGLLVKTISFVVAMRHIHLGLSVPDLFQKVREHCGSSDAVTIKIGIYGDMFVALKCRKKTLERLLHVWKKKRVMTMVFVIGIEKRFRIRNTSFIEQRFQ